MLYSFVLFCVCMHLVLSQNKEQLSIENLKQIFDL